MAHFEAVRHGFRPDAVAIALLSCLLHALACASLPFGDEPVPHCPVSLVPSEELDPGLRMRVNMHVTTPESSLRVEASIERRDGALVIAGFTPFGTRAFAITQEGTKLRVEEHFGRHMGVRSALIVDALHRALLLPSRGEARWQWGGEWVEERRAGGMLESRVFRAVEPDPEAGDAAGARADYGVHERVAAFEVENLWCPYEARLVVLATNRPQAPDSLR